MTSGSGGDPERGRPSVLVLTIARDVTPYLAAYFEALEALAYPKACLSIGVLEGDSTDETARMLSRRLATMGERYARTRLAHCNSGLDHAGPRWDASFQRRRRSALARLRNLLLRETLDAEEWVLWIDADVIGYPIDTLTRLLAAGKDIVTPHCVREPGGPSFDLNTFRSTERSLRKERCYLVDGIVQPPYSLRRRYLHDFRGRDLVRVDAVGGTMLLVRAELHRRGLAFPEESYNGYIETEGLAMMARDMGIACWAMPDLEVLHAQR